MILLRIFFIDDDWVKAQIHPVLSKTLAQEDKCRHLLFHRGKIRFQIFPIICDRKFKTVGISKPVDHFQIRKHRLRILCPEHETINGFRRQFDAAYLFSVVRMRDQDFSCKQPLHEPFGIQGRNVGPSTYTDNHLLISLMEIFYNKMWTHARKEQNFSAPFH